MRSNVSDLVNLYTFRNFVKMYKVSIFKRRSFAKYINGLGLGRSEKILMRWENWLNYFTKFKNS